MKSEDKSIFSPYILLTLRDILNLLKILLLIQDQ